MGKMEGVQTWKSLRRRPTAGWAKVAWRIQSARAKRSSRHYPCGRWQRRLGDDLVDEQCDQSRLVVHVVVQGHRRHTQSLGDQAHAEPAGTLLVGHLQGGPGDPRQGQLGHRRTFSARSGCMPPRQIPG